MICAWISETEMIPFDKIDAVDLDMKYPLVYIENRNDPFTVEESDKVEFVKQYTAYLTMISKATSLLEGIE